MAKALKFSTLGLLILGAAVLFLGFVGGSPAAMLAGVSILCPAVLMFPIIAFRGAISPFDPAFIVLGYTIIGCLGTGIDIAYGSGRRHDYLMNGEPISFFVTGGFWVLAGLLTFAIGNCVLGTRRRPFKFQAVTLSKKYLILVGILAIGVSLFATYKFVMATGGIDLESLSRKRTMIVYDANGNEVVAGFAYVRNLAGVTIPVLLMLLAVQLRQVGKLHGIDYFMILGLGGSAIILPFLASSRTDVAVVLIQIIMMLGMFGRFKISTVIATGAVILAIFGVMTTLRLQAHNSIVQHRNPVTSAVVSVVESGNGLSIVSNALVVQRVPERLDYLYGNSLWTWIVQPIPRTMWPDKPDVALSRLIKEKILGLEAIATGRPPSLMAEGWMNFGFIGFFVFAFLFGGACRWFWEYFRPYLGKDIPRSALYLVLLPDITSAVAAGLSQVIVRGLTDSVLFCIVLFVVRPRKARQPGTTARRQDVFSAGLRQPPLIEPSRSKNPSS